MVWNMSQLKVKMNRQENRFDLWGLVNRFVMTFGDFYWILEGITQQNMECVR